jgi:glyoxylase-like metal-dependent hydrolase (beta-lactamase superfamily II)
MEVQELAEGLWRWTAPHPDWRPGAEWGRDVGCVYYEGPDAVVLIDPLVPTGEEERFWHALERDVERAGRPVRVLLTLSDHRRSADEIALRYGARTWTFGVDDALPEGVEAYDAMRMDETVLWIVEHRTLVFGDVLVDGPRLCPQGWVPEGTTAELKETLRPLLELPVERLLISHGEPVLERAHEQLARLLAA